MRLFVAEKPSLARAIADVLPAPHRKHSGFIECGDRDVVTWCAGHILELAEPEQYRPEFKTWTMGHLPIIPQKWQLAVTAPDLLRTIKQLLPRASEVVHAGDPDREGQLLVDEVLEYLRYRGPVWRVLVNDMNPASVRKALDRLQPNSAFRGLCDSARARQRADWLYGLNLTRLYTLLGRAGGYDGVLSVGRVQTPLLGLIVRRDQEIAAFKSRPYFVPKAQVVTPQGSFAALWQPGPTHEAALDPEGRLVKGEVARYIQRVTSGKTGVVTRCSQERKSAPAPLPYSLPDLQMDGSKRLNLSPKRILDVCQSLYETHRLTTYPRSDCSYLPDAHHAQADQVVAAIARVAPSLQAIVDGADPRLKCRAFNDGKVSAHHAIIPTPSLAGSASLSRDESDVYRLIARRYVALFYPPFEYNETKIEVTVAEERFAAGGRHILVTGWHAALAPEGTSAAADSPDADAVGQILPPVEQGERVSVSTVDISERRTKPPKAFTGATLIQAMTGISRFVSDPHIKKLLRDTDGIGTPATQASIIQTLFDRRYIVEEDRKIRSTPTARVLVAALPVATTQPDMTALWEAAMRKIQDGGMPLETFLAGVLKGLGELVAHGKHLGALHLPGVSPPRPCPRSCGGVLRERKGKNGPFLGCSTYPTCTFTTEGAAASTRASQRRSQPRTQPVSPK